jgi:CheY-like chemotaxis protein
MVAEDDDAMRRLLTRVLSRERYRVTALADAVQLVDRLLAASLEERPDLIISDVKMPGISGLDLLERLEATGLRIPIVLISAFCDEQTLGRAAQLGAVCVLSKPFEMDMLRNLALCLLSPEGPVPGSGSSEPAR